MLRVPTRARSARRQGAQGACAIAIRKPHPPRQTRRQDAAMVERRGGTRAITPVGAAGGTECMPDEEQIRKTQDEPQWIVAQGLLSALTIPGFS